MTSDFGMAVAGEHVLSRLGVRSGTTLKDFRGLLSGNAISISRLRLVNGLKRRLTGLLSISD